jgi:hypothetical protein
MTLDCITDENGLDFTPCASFCGRTCNADYCRHEHARESNMITGGRCDAGREGIQFDSTGLPLEKGDVTT